MLEIKKIGDEVLRRTAKPVRYVNQSVRALLKEMAETMYAAPGVGLAAPQIGIGKRIVVVDVGDGLFELVNPEIVEREGAAFDWEGCLSIPGLVGDVERATHVRVRALDGEGRQVWIDADDYFARCLQHEIDHLDGVMFVDRARTVRETPKPGPRIVFFGTPEFAVPSLAALLDNDFNVIGVVTQPDRPAGRGLALQPSAIKELALDAELPILQPERVRDPEAIAAIANWRPDILVVVAYGQILPQALLEMGNFGAVNVHASLLPKYRGAAPINWAIMGGDQVTGVSLQHMVRKLDAGDVISQFAVPIGPDETAGELHDRLSELGAKLLVETLPPVFDGTASRTPQDAAAVSLAPTLSRDSAAIDWSQPAERIACLVRGLNPWPVAFTTTDHGRLKIWRATALADAENGASAAAPGEVIAVGDAGIDVATGHGSIRLLEVQPEGRRRQTAGEFLRGHRLDVGARLGGPAHEAK